MKLGKEHIVVIAVLVAVLAASFGVYQFYYTERLKTYRADLAQLQALEQTLTRLETTFKPPNDAQGATYHPTALISALKGAVDPINEDLRRWAAYFNIEGFRDIEPIPENVMIRFYYDEQYRKAFADLRQYAVSHTPYCPYPDTNFGVPSPDKFVANPMDRKGVETALKTIAFGSAMVKMLIDAKAVSITAVELWPTRKDMNGMLWLSPTGLSFSMKLGDLVTFLETLRTEGRYFNVNSLAVRNRYLRYYQAEPPVDVQMVLSQAEPVIKRIEGSEAGATGRAGGPLPPAAPAAPAPVEESGWAKTRTWMRNHYLWPF